MCNNHDPSFVLPCDSGWLTCTVCRCREFRVILRRDPTSVFSSNVEIETTSGPIYYDTSRVYTGTLEGKAISFVCYYFENCIIVCAQFTLARIYWVASETIDKENVHAYSYAHSYQFHVQKCNNIKEEKQQTQIEQCACIRKCRFSIVDKNKERKIKCVWFKEIAVEIRHW